VYDGDCPLCIGIVRWITRLGWANPATVAAYDELDPELQQRVRDAGIRNAMAVVDRVQGDVRTGFDGMERLARETSAPGLRLLVGAGRWTGLGDPLYRFIAANRRVLAPPRRDPTVGCSCDPDPAPLPQYGLASMLLILGALGSGVLFHGLASGPGAGAVSFGAGVLVGALAAVVGGLVVALAGRRRAHPTVATLWGHWSWAWAAGSLLLVPAGLVLRRLDGRPAMLVIGLALAIAAALVARSLARRLGPVSRWLGGWGTAIAAAALATAALLA
jgi:predicted DCC family thiol-disulfide oxidoreductase YuxK